MLLAYGSKQFKAEAYPRMVLALTSVAEVDGATVSFACGALLDLAFYHLFHELKTEKCVSTEKTLFHVDDEHLFSINIK